MSSRQIAKSIAGFANDKKAEDILVLDMRKVANFCDYFVIASASNERQVRAVGDSIIEGLGGLGVDTVLTNGHKEGYWAVYDAGDVITHVLHKKARDFYSLEKLWREAKPVKWD